MAVGSMHKRAGGQHTRASGILDQTYEDGVAVPHAQAFEHSIANENLWKKSEAPRASVRAVVAMIKFCGLLILG